MARSPEARTDALSALRQLAASRQPGDEGRAAAAFLERYYASSSTDDLTAADPADLYGAAVAHREMATGRRPGHPAVRVFAPRFEVQGWSSKHTVVQVVTDDMPFVVDSIRMAITQRRIGIHVLRHPIIDDVSMVHIEVDRNAQRIADELEAEIERALGDVGRAVGDWPAMVDDMIVTIERLERRPMAQVDPDDHAEAVAFLRWLAEGHFTFLGARTYELEGEGEALSIRRVEGSGLGILREEVGASATRLSPAARQLAAEPTPLVLTKANAMSTVHRSARLDYVGVRLVDDHGRVTGERRYLGLYTSSMYATSPSAIPLLRQKVEHVRALADFPPDSHSAKDLAAILDTYPRDELIQVPAEVLCATAVAIHEIQERILTRVFLRRDRYERFWTALVYLPRDRYDTQARLAVQDILTKTLDSGDVVYETLVSNSTLARLYYVIHGGVGEDAVDPEEVEHRVASAVRGWTDDLQDALVEDHGEDRGMVLADRYGTAFGPGYGNENTVRIAVADIDRLEALGVDDIDFQLRREPGAPPTDLRLRVYRSGPEVLVSDLVPILEDLGAKVVVQRPFAVRPNGDGDVARMHVYDMSLRVGSDVEIDIERDAVRVVELLHGVWAREVGSDRLNRLVLGAGLTSREVAIVRAYTRYLRQAGTPFSTRYVEACVTAHPVIARSLVELFRARFTAPVDHDSVAELDGWLVALLDGVASLDEDRVLRSLLHLVRATLRTNTFQPAVDGGPKAYFSFKFDPQVIPELPLPRPHREVFVYSPRVEGVHLRGAPVARGGLRWSDRREDYRTEVLGLMKAQMVKNAVIVPSGAKGGFIVKQPPADPAALRAEVVECYRTFVSGLLDLTDNLAGDEVVPPAGVVRHDGDDFYLVVAADKGTATFSDIANEVAAGYGYWLGDAFASGGSAGYDHKAMGITARGAWESVKRHFRELHVDVQHEPITVVGIGDMAGDVFGNGMLLSEHLEVVAAFNHQHIFLDPEPDPAASFAERRRLFTLTRSSWDDYDRDALSAGGGIFRRTAKSIPLTDEVRRLLGVEVDSLTPNETIRALLRAPVDLLWNGGIGTYVKASTEAHAEAGDKTNDAVRVDADELRCRVIGEGGNLGLTQRARIEFARAGGRVNTDAIDNAAGVDCSDHEVNIKIVVDAAVANGDLTVKQRSELLASMTDDVAELVLADNIRQNQALVNAEVQGPSLIDVHQRYIHSLESDGLLDRAVEFVPSDDELAERKAAGHGLAAPEFAVLLAYTKNLLADELLLGTLPDDPWCERLLVDYFPPALRERHLTEIRRHRLRREIIATTLANAVVDEQGITSLYRLRDETGADLADAARTMVAATAVFDLSRFRAQVADLDHEVPAAVQTQMLLEARKLAERGSRWLLRTRRDEPIGDLVGRYASGVATLIETLPSILVGAERTSFDSVRTDLERAGVPGAIARRSAGLDELFGGLDCVDLAVESFEEVEAVAAVRFELEDRLGMVWLFEQVAGLPRGTRWQTLARLSLREDLLVQLRRLTGLVLGSTAPDLGADQRVATWLSAHEQAVDRLGQILGDIRAAGSGDLATLSVGLREVTQLR